MAGALAAAVGAAACLSLRSALLLLAWSSVVVLAAKGLGRLLPLSTLAGGLLGAGLGSALWLLTRAFFSAFAADLAVPEGLLFSLFFLCGMTGTAPLSVSALWRTAGAWCAVGALRELLAAGTLFAWPLPVAEVSPSFGWGVGGLLLAAGGVWVFRLGFPHRVVPQPPYRTASLTAAVVMAAVGALQLVLPPLAVWWRYWWSALATVALLTLIGWRWPAAAPFWESGPAAAIPAVALLVPREWPAGLLWVALSAVGMAVAAGALYAFSLRLRRLPPSMGGAPAALLIAAFAMAAFAPL